MTLYRAYQPDRGRWISRDWIAEAAGLNLYDYILNSPLNRYDPFGLQGEEEDTPDPLMGGAGTCRAQKQIRDIGDFASEGAGIAYPDNGKGFFETPSIWCKIKATFKWLFHGNEILNKYDQKCKDCDK